MRNWTRRWFVLKQSGQIPGQYVLEYYTDETCRKLKGRVDLDQCEQVDAGLSLNCPRKSYPFMFDVKTSKRVYYLVAKTEAEMNRWIECICSVCGLKVHYEESIDYRYSPQPSQECVVSASGVGGNNNNSNSNSPPVSNASSTLNTVVIKSEPRSSSSSEANKSHMNKKKYESSGPYVPIWETNTGKPIFERPPLKENTSRENIVDIPVKQSAAIDDDAYDVPRPLNLASEIAKSSDNILYKVPPVQKFLNGDSITPPKVNWKTHPNPDSVTFATDVGRSSVRSCGQGQPSKEPTLETRRASTPTANYYNSESIVLNESIQKPPPPRPPKPESLRKTRNNSESCISTHTDASSSSLDTAAFMEDKTSQKDDYSPTTKVPLPSTLIKQHPQSPDEMYDIPRPSEHQQPVTDILNAAVPVLPNSLKRSGRHSYTNAPPGHISTKESIFIYDTKPCLPTTCDDQVVSMDSEGSDRSPVTPNSALYTNLSSNTFSKGITPPAVNRDLKPRRKSSDSDAAPSPTTTTAGFTLCPPPAVSEVYNKKAFRKHRYLFVKIVKRFICCFSSPNRALNGTPPRIPSRGRQIVHSREPSASEDDSTFTRSRKESTEDQVRQTVPVPRKQPPAECGEIQYLDLSLDSDNTSPAVRLGSGSDTHKSLQSLTKESTENSVAAAGPDSGSTVYKTVDFLKTKAFNKLRLNLEESHRSSQ
ncbi:Grb2 associated binder (Gab)-like protein [Dinothrombium tinctorium]|uniref:Grb2 associated binder (Gab)-like protein n=1 Tax=Dinothrombium tinctorium TaxID=1965070 RepID=A0A3S3SHP7_9ACAR|nr:Grb2 associated binder (Gab)-like protein [Dinothrombium tinctorium]